MNLLLFFLWLSWKLKHSQCLECHKRTGFSGLCAVCLSRYQSTEIEQCQAKRSLVLSQKTQVSVFVATPWSQKIRKKWYRYKFLKAYAETGLFVALLKSVACRAITQGSQQEALPPQQIWLTHPPAKPNKAYPWGRIVQRLAAQQGWRYEPNLLVWQASEAVGFDQKSASSKHVRQQQRATAFIATTNPPLLQQLKENPPKLVLLLDDIMTTGATLQGCLVALEGLMTPLLISPDPPSIQVGVLTEVPL